MTKQKSTKRALLLSALSLLMCVSMLIGSTFAWFTDSVTSAGNKIQSGTLVLDLELLDKDGNWNSIKTSKAPIFNYDLWEPGYTDVKILKVENEGNLALKWIAKFVSAGELGILADVIDVYVKPSANALTYPADRVDLTEANGWVKKGTVKDFVDTIEQTTYGSLKAGESAYLGIALKMQESAGNDYQNKTLGAFDIRILATQNTVESDSFNNQYDANAEYDESQGLSSGADLHNSTTNSGTFKLMSDIRTSESSDDARYGYGYEYIVRKGANYTLDLNGKTIEHDFVYENANKNAYTYLLVANNPGTKLTIDGDGDIYCHNSEGYTCAIQGKNETEVIINSGDVRVHKGIAVWAGAGSHIVINDGSFISTGSAGDVELIYSSGGVIDIYGGFFHNEEWENRPVNVANANRGTGRINIYGGTFVNFDPSTGGDDPDQIKVMEGYKVVSETQANGDIWYTVVAE